MPPLPTVLYRAGALVVALVALAGGRAAAQDLAAPCTDGSADGYACFDVDLVARLPTSALDIAAFGGLPAGNDLWGWTDPDTGVEYALVGTTEGVVFVSLEDPAAPAVVGTLPSATTPSTWRDVKTNGAYAYVVSEAFAHGMQVFDLRRLRDVARPPVVFEADARYTGVGNAHNVVAAEGVPYVYIVGGTSSSVGCAGGGLHIVDVSDPTAPRFAGCYDDAGYTHDAQCVVYDGPDHRYTGRTLCFSSNGSFGPDDVLSISDVTDAGAPTGISTVAYPLPGYAHQGWLTEDQRYFLLDDEFDEGNGSVSGTRTLVFDLSDLEDPVYVGANVSDVLTIDHNQYVRGRFTYQSNYTSGLRIYELTDLDAAELTLVGAFDTYPLDDGVSYEGQWSNYPYFESGLIIANDQANGLFVLRPSPGSPVASEDAAAPDALPAVGAAYPNPFRTRAALDLRLGAPERVRAEAFDLLGRRVAVLLDGVVAEGRLALDGAGLPAGVYVVRVTGETFAATRRVTKVR